MFLNVANFPLSIAEDAVRPCKLQGMPLLRGLFAIGNGCKKLRNLILSHKGLEAIATGCKELAHLEVNGCHNIRGLGLESMEGSCQMEKDASSYKLFNRKITQALGMVLYLVYLLAVGI
ncbi:hypothetical protein HN51_064714 [Arachis hypogaea]